MTYEDLLEKVFAESAAEIKAAESNEPKVESEVEDVEDEDDELIDEEDDDDDEYEHIFEEDDEEDE